MSDSGDFGFFTYYLVGLAIGLTIVLGANIVYNLFFWKD